MSAVEHLHQKETVLLDREQLKTLYLQLDPIGADKMVNQSLEDLAVCLAQIKKMHLGGQAEEARHEIRSLLAIARKLGMTTLARICRDALDLVGGSDGIGCQAVLARLNRVGEGSLIAVWDLQDMSV
ncbi:hypothetical protein O2N63_00665 [Aliiroseovarius sp. KMU-50]|uniref:Hpt domain-containing protein n=1 Tax=Aliiroseovarius salicola TaxID=3009082 RepID=A0ABT4VWH3_9RHOB|nr:hypothetical protein [Aliiroseovarius sp. KMU-50]MDA5092600.1 hypothetical protein [Aliiroseovarius sp. KMU-50]